MNAIARLLEAIEYPETAPAGASSFTLLVDGAEIFATEDSGRLRLSFRLADAPEELPRLAAWAAGRMLREEAAVAFGETVGPSNRSTVEPFSSAAAANGPTVQRSNGPTAFLWQDAPADAVARDLRRLFETFCDSCDWWRERVSAPAGDPAADIPSNEMRILP